MSKAKEKECPCCRTKVRDEKELKDLIHRLNRVEGQIRGIKGYLKSGICGKQRAEQFYKSSAQ